MQRDGRGWMESMPIQHHRRMQHHADIQEKLNMETSLRSGDFFV